MRIYIKDKPLRIKKPDEVGDLAQFNGIVEDDDLLINEKLFKGHLLIRNATHSTIKSVLFIMHNKKLKNLSSITVLTENYDEAIDYIKSKFKILKAGGGVVYRDGSILLIHRLGKWDLPKGKIEKGESFVEGAKREVQEECNIKVRVNQKICTTWHTYTKGDKSILKKTVWYLMDCLDDSKMKPQLEEDIDEVRWMSENELNVALYNTYMSIAHVYNKFKKLKKTQSV
ncbi:MULTISPECIES: NUDIX hydrolase [Roseivirga]|jgi:ADP-ribose pyrophosphatase YjhB (NUDIX family)|uniref:NUDIX hydrolase n=1 Tax=Roseivirga TaxID=290180 RepID=UPI00257CDC8F|nr:MULTISPECIES: NUDIX hydrolase [Roseivirga]|tara:strand:- start:20385 stop:21068 length:684 start_codon:yes stop_codon:yes gene_type:complete